MLKAIKIRIYPNQEQTEYINRLLGCCRFVYNQCLEYRKTKYEENKLTFNTTQTVNYLTVLKGEYEFLKEVHSKVLQQSVRNLCTAYDNFFKLKKGYPKFKSKKDKQSCRFPKDAFIGINGNRISLIKQLKSMHFKCSRKDEKYVNKRKEYIHSLTLTKSKSNKFYLSILIDFTPLQKKHNENIVGIDMGIKDFVITSDCEYYKNRHFYKENKKKLVKLQREFSKKIKGSKNRDKVRIKIAKLNEKISNCRKNYIHLITSKLINENQVICVEDLNVKGMLKNHKLSQSIQDVAIGDFFKILEYKCSIYGRKLVKVDRFFPSSKRCNHCGYINKELKLNDRQWLCPQCGHNINRDLNAALNIKNEGIRIIGLSSPELTLVDYPTMDDRSEMNLKSSDRLKQEKNDFIDFQ